MGATTHDPTMPTAGVIKKAKPVTTEGGLDPEEVIALRLGDVLIKHTVLKADHFPSCHNTKLSPILEGAPNFRKVDGLRVYGVAIPTVKGLRHVVATMKTQELGGCRKVYWQNLREEPLIFINGNPFVVREADQPFSNLEYTGINRVRVEEMEVRLKADILTEAVRFNSRILVLHENEDLSLFDHWEPVSSADVQTPQEVYNELNAEGYEVNYIRVPITDEKAPKDDDFEELIEKLWTLPNDAGVIFNCQMGRGRTTTGMVIATLLNLRKMEAFPLKKGKKETRDIVPGWFKTATQPLIAGKGGVPHATEGSLETRLKAGNYGVIRSLLRALEKGVEAKIILDAAIDACGAMQNLREGIFSYRSRFLKEAREKQRNVLLNVCLEYLERYYMLIAFTGYLASASFDPGSPAHVSFPAWMAARPELRSILGRLLRRNSMSALELHTRTPDVVGAPSSAGGNGVGGDGLDDHDHATKDDGKDVVATRTGAVLGAYSILKEDNFPGMQSAKIPQSIEGAPNFRGMPHVPVYGVGMPTVDGITGVMQALAGGSDTTGKHLQALWVNMREEPVVYINGRPFVLREEVRPLKNMMEYEGIDAARLEAMEERLKKDVLAEALRHGGRILVAHESFEYGHYGELYDTWEEIDHPDAVQTPAEVYASLTEQGFAVSYLRLPVTDGAAPQLLDFDRIVQALLSLSGDHPVIFNCQMGIGRTTTGMVIGSLVHVYRAGQLEHTRSQPNLLDAADNPAALRGYIVSGLSPRSDQDEDAEEFTNPDDDEGHVKIWDIPDVEADEQRSLAAGGYVGVRRVVRLLEEGDSAKRALDTLVDAASVLINLRVAIMKYRKPRSSYKFLRPELQQRGAAFKKGGSYLERYVLLIAFTYYLEHVGPETDTFSEWMKSRPDLMSALAAVHANPGAALAPLPIPKPPVLLEGDEQIQQLRDQTKVMARRRGRLLNKRTILKSYLFHPPPAVEETQQPLLEGAFDLKRVLDDLPIYSVGSLTMEGLRAVLTYLGANQGGKCTVCISDIREELVVYVNGVPYTRRELEMPAAALHHAGVQAGQLEEQEVLMREDVQDEAGAWGGKLLLHKEVQEAELALMSSPRSSLSGLAGATSAPSPLPALTCSSIVPAARPTKSHIVISQKRDDVTNVVDSNPGAQVAAFWELVDLNNDDSVMTARELVERLIEAEHFQVTYRRIPLSRERTPDAHDLQQVHSQLLEANEASFKSERRTTTLHLVLSRTSTGSSSRFVCAALASYYIRPTRASLTGAPLLPVAHLSQSAPLAFINDDDDNDDEDTQQPNTLQRRPSATGLTPLVIPPPVVTADSGKPLGATRSLDLSSGEYRGIMALCRLLAGGIEAKLAVDRAIALTRPIGDLLADIKMCKDAAGSLPSQPMASDPEAVLRATLAHHAARQLGLHYLKRYFLLITYRCFLEQCGTRRAGYADWVEQQKELEHLLSHLTLDS